MKAKTKKVFLNIGLYFALIVLYCALHYLYIYPFSLLWKNVELLCKDGVLSQKEGGLYVLLTSSTYIFFCLFFIIEMYFDLCFVIIRRKIKHYKYDKPEMIFDILALIFIILTTALSISYTYIWYYEIPVNVFSLNSEDFIFNIAIFSGFAYYVVRVITIVYKIVKVIKKHRKKKQEVEAGSISLDNSLDNSLDTNLETN